VVQIVPVIMSGGSGTRLWPLSRTASPKQLHALVSEMTLVQETVMRVTGSEGDYVFTPPVIILNESQHELASRQLDALGVAPSHYVVEPFGRNTAAVAAVAAEVVEDTYGADALVLLLPADHHIRDVAAFRRAIAAGAELAAAGHIITFGIAPDRPETGYGYILRGEPVGEGYGVSAFKEKPDRARAEAFLADGRYYWNAGIFMFGAAAAKDEMARYCPQVLDASADAVRLAVREGAKVLLDGGALQDCPSISFDYAVMERTDRAAVVPADIGWSDVGSWNALWEIAGKDGDGNVARGDVEFVDTRNSYALSDGCKLGVVGMTDVVVVATADAVLVVDRSASQEVKTVVERLKAQDRTDLL